MSEDRIRGDVDEAKGKVKEGVGSLTGDRSTEWSGKVDQVKGQVERKVGDVRDAEHKSDKD